MNGRRGSLSEPELQAHQIIKRRDSSRAARRGVGQMRFEVSRDHRHWHYLGFEEYELRTADGDRLVRPSRKTGFCLGDRYSADTPPPRTPREPRLTGNCGRDPRLRAVDSGISVGYGDDYETSLEGQSLDLTRLPAGRYVVVHRVNADRLLLERDYENNAASVLIRLRWPGGFGERPRVERLRSCPDSEHCGGVAEI